MKITRSKDLFSKSEAFPEHSGRLYERVHYVDLKEVCFLTNSDIARLIDKVKYNLSSGIETRVINVKPEVMDQLKQLELDSIINFE